MKKTLKSSAKRNIIILRIIFRKFHRNGVRAMERKKKKKNIQILKNRILSAKGYIVNLYFSHFSHQLFFPSTQFYFRCFLSSATAFRAYLRATHLLEFLSENFTGTSRLPRSLLFYPSFFLKKGKKKFSTSLLPCTSSDPSGRFAGIRPRACSFPLAFILFFYWVSSDR